MRSCGVITQDPELERFKTEINLSEYAASLGYEWKRRESSRNSVVMRHANGDKIVIARGHDEHWIFFSVRDDADNGSIIDFRQNRAGGSLGQVRKALRPWVSGGRVHRPLPESFAAHVEKSTQDRQGVIAAYARMQDAAFHAYLESRAIGKETLADPRFIGRIRRDVHGNAIFPHFDEQGLSGYEIKNADFTGFARGGEKGLWASHIEPDDRRLVICESAIDALSYHALHPGGGARYVSTGGAWSDKARELLRRAGEKHPGPEIVLAFDNDAQGRAYETEARALLSDTGKITLTGVPHPGLDWNDELQRRRPHVAGVQDRASSSRTV